MLWPTKPKIKYTSADTWKKYRDNQSGLEFKYPPTASVSAQTNYIQISTINGSYNKDSFNIGIQISNDPRNGEDESLTKITSPEQALLGDKKTTSINGIKAAEVIFPADESNRFKRLIAFMKEKSLITIDVNGAKTKEVLDTVDTIFSTFTFIGK